MKIITMLVPAVAAAAAALSTTHVPPPARHHKPVCAKVVLSQQTVTGQEADLPVKFCGRMARRGSWQCLVTPAGPLRANARLVCSRS